MACVLARYGTFTALMPAMARKRSPAMRPPTLALAKLRLALDARAEAMNACRVSAFTRCGLTTRKYGVVAKVVNGVKSRSGS